MSACAVGALELRPWSLLPNFSATRDHDAQPDSKAVGQAFQCPPRQENDDPATVLQIVALWSQRMTPSPGGEAIWCCSGSLAKARRFSNELSGRFGIRPETVESSGPPIPKTRFADNYLQAIPSSATGSHATPAGPNRPDAQTKYLFRGKGGGMAARTPTGFATQDPRDATYFAVAS